MHFEINGQIFPSNDLEYKNFENEFLLEIDSNDIFLMLQNIYEKS